MSELIFKGKEFVYNHHLAVPFRPLVPDLDKGVGPVALDGNLIIHGDNLHALKALLPLYAGKVDCIFIDPPYNTGNEGWSYNDNVNAPMIREWLESNPIGIEDGLRHDKWCAMMWPRLRLLHELLGDTGSFWMTIDDNEMHRSRAMLDEIFGEQNFVAVSIWHKSDSPKNTAQHFSVDHDYVLIYAKDKSVWRPNLVPRTEAMLARYTNPDNDPRGVWMTGDLDARNYYSKGTYSIQIPGGDLIPGPPRGRYWTVSEDKFWDLDGDKRIWWGEDGRSQPNVKKFLNEVRDGVVPQTLWSWSEVGSTRNSKSELNAILHGVADEEDPELDAEQPADDEVEGSGVFVTPKPTRLLQRVLAIATTSNSVVLDSFAGSGTTGHAVLLANKRDGGRRRVILVEVEDYANELTAERMRRVVNGYPYKGKKREELAREKLSFSKLRRADKLLHNLDAIMNLERDRFDNFETKLDKGFVVVSGMTNVEAQAEGLGGTFTYCTLGQPVELDKLLSGATLPPYAGLGAALFHMATNQALDPAEVREEDFHLGATQGQQVWLIYKPDLDWLKSPEAALTLARAKAFAASDPNKRHLVFAPARFVSQKMLTEQNLLVEFVPLPFALYRIDRS
jgi:adenine-specific DNA-methyltransferase